MPVRVLVALGSNLGDRVARVREAIHALEPLATGSIEASSIYRTEPQAMAKDAEAFANAAVRFDTNLAASDLLAAMQDIEVAMGRPRDHGANVSRTIDLDLITYGDCRIDEPGLQVPHPRAHERTFVLMPLLEIDPEATLGPGTVRECLAALTRASGAGE